MTSTRSAEILAVAARQFAAKGVDGTAMREIAGEIGLNVGALYHYFPGKDAIVTELISSYLTELLAGYRTRSLESRTGRERLRAIVEVSLATAQELPDATQVYQAEFAKLRSLPGYEDLVALSDAVQGQWLDAIEAGKASGEFRRDIPTKVFHRFIRDAVWLTVRWHHPDDPYTIAELAHDCLAVFLDGFANPAPRRDSGIRTDAMTFTRKSRRTAR